jgi:lipopolysaccharide/colanic/teichoic acid biosynthesis glycosyltransferase
MDIIISAVALVFLSPLLIVIALTIRWRMGSPVFFGQTRAGFRGNPFTLYKFRTMIHERDREGHLLPDAERLMPIGLFLRSTSLDELPELWNVLKGAMSLVGPRPLLMDYLPLYTPEQMRRHDVKPGITGWAQINGRNTITWEEKFTLDVWYVDHQSLCLDIRILWVTLFNVFSRKGITPKGEAIMPRFTGVNNNESNK